MQEEKHSKPKRSKAKDTAYQRMEILLSTHLYRHSCPKPELLGLYQLHLLPSQDELLIAQHIRQCPHCQRELNELNQAEEKDISWLERLRRASEFIEAQSIPTPRWLTAGLRGAGRPPQRFGTEALEIHISQQPGYSHGRWMLLGRLEPQEQPASAVKGTEVLLIQGETIWKAITNANGAFVFEEIMSGTYDIGLEWNEQVIIACGVKVQ